MTLLTNLPTRLHHHAHVVRDQEATRHFYEDVLGLPLVATWCEIEDLRGKVREYCHTFFGLADGSALAFFQMADPADYEELHSQMKPGSLGHLALNVTPVGQAEIEARLDQYGVHYRAVDHGYCRSIYLADPDGKTVEFTRDAANADHINEVRRADAHSELNRWLAGDHKPNNDLR